MPSNFWFIVLKRWRKDNKGRGTYLVLEVASRSKDGVLVHKILDASFKLSRVKIADYSGTETSEPFVNLKYVYDG